MNPFFWTKRFWTVVAFFSNKPAIINFSGVETSIFNISTPKTQLSSTRKVDDFSSS
jgi:hypothetical protein